MTTTTIITTCKGRLKHLQVSIASWLTATPAQILVVADGCPDLSYGELPAVFGDPRIKIRLTQAGVHSNFSKPRALNLGARIADTQHLLFLDCDTLVMNRFWQFYERRVTPDALFIVPPSPERRDLTGVLGVSRDEFLAVDGADEGMVGWGSEDLDLRLRIYLSARVRLVEIPPELLSSIPHDDSLRTRYYSEQDKMESHRRNLQRLVNNAERVSGQSIWSLIANPTVSRMFGSGLGPETPIVKSPDGQTRTR